MNRAIRVGVISLGCAKNLVDSEIMMGLLAEAGHTVTPSAAEADAIIINTCGFITPAKEEAVNTILETARLKEEGGLKLLLVAGCLAQRYGEELLSEMPEIDGVIGPGQIGKVVGLLDRAAAGGRLQAVGDPGFDYCRVMPRMLATPSHWAYVKVADGCNNRCSYCAIPGIRGGYRSRPMEVLEDEVSSLVKKGVREIILVAQDTTAYGLDIYRRPALAELLRRLAAAGVPWIRVMYCYPTGFTPELIRVMREEKNICSYVDLPLQHINDGILKKMNRRGTSLDIKRLISELRDSIPGITLRTTFIVGFPGEGEAEFADLYKFVEETRFDRMGVFKYSPEEGTAAYGLGDTVPEDIKERRYDMLMNLQQGISLEHNRNKVNSTVRVLVDGRKSGSHIFYGRTEGDAPEVDGSVIFSSGPRGIKTGEFVDVRVTKAFDYGLRGVMDA